MYSKFLSRLLSQKERDGNFLVIKVRIGKLVVLHLLYVDDELICNRANDEDAAFAMSCFRKYCFLVKIGS